jgi:hypothetical protein
MLLLRTKQQRYIISNIESVVLRNPKMNTPTAGVKYKLTHTYPKEVSGDYSSFLIKNFHVSRPSQTEFRTAQDTRIIPKLSWVCIPPEGELEIEITSGK